MCPVNQELKYCFVLVVFLNSQLLIICVLCCGFVFFFFFLRFIAISITSNQ
jgi:hypothetical protein